jgi:hypothetical protein
MAHVCDDSIAMNEDEDDIASEMSWDAEQHSGPAPTSVRPFSEGSMAKAKTAGEQEPRQDDGLKVGLDKLSPSVYIFNDGTDVDVDNPVLCVTSDGLDIHVKRVDGPGSPATTSGGPFGEESKAKAKKVGEQEPRQNDSLKVGLDEIPPSVYIVNEGTDVDVDNPVLCVTLDGLDIHVKKVDGPGTKQVDSTVGQTSLSGFSKSDPPEIDHAKLFGLIDKNGSWGDSIQGQDVIWLFGLVGAGKTTTLLHLAGVKFEKIDTEDGDIHLKPVFLPCDELSKFKVAGGANSVTTTLQATHVMQGDSSLVIVDMPGFRDTQSMETEIANCIALKEAMHRARKVLPVLVIGFDSFGSRGHLVKDVLSQVSTMTGGLDFSAFAFLFTFCKIEEGSRISKKLVAIRKSCGGDAAFTSLLDEMIRKTAVGTTIVAPLDEHQDPDHVIRSLFMQSDGIDMNPSAFAGSFLAEATCNSIRVGLQKLATTTQAYVGIDNSKAELALEVLHRYECHLPELAKQYTEGSRAFIASRAAQWCQEIESGLLHLRNMSRGNALAAREQFETMGRILGLVFNADKLCALSQVPRNNRLSALTARLSTGVAGTLEECLPLEELARSHEVLNSQKEKLRWRLVCSFGLRNALKGLPKFEDADHAYSKLLTSFIALLDSVLSAAQKLIMSSLQDLVAFRTFLVFLKEVSSDLTHYVYVDMEENFEWTTKRLGQLESGMKKVVMERRKEISDVVGLLNNVVSVKAHWSACNPSFLIDVDYKGLGLARSLLVDLSSEPMLAAELPPTFRLEDAVSLVNDLDSAVREYVKQVACFADRSTTDFYENGVKGDVASRKRELQSTTTALDTVLQMISTLRSWRHVRVTWDDDWRVIVETRKALALYSDHLCEESAGLADGLHGAIKSADGFLMRLQQTEMGNTWNLLAEAGQANCWECWSSFLEKESSGLMASVFRFVTNSEDKVKKLRATLSTISSLFQKSLQYSLGRIIQMMTPETRNVSQLLLQDLTSEVMMCFEFFKLDASSGLVIALRGDKPICIRDGLRVRRLLTIAFAELSALPKKLLDERSFEDMNGLLNLWKGATNSRFWEETQSFCLFSINGHAEDWKVLQEAINSCPSYNVIREKTTKAVRDLEEEVNVVSLDSVMTAVSDLDRQSFYKSVLDLLNSTYRLRSLADHFPDDHRFRTLYDAMLDKMKSQIEQLGFRLAQHLSDFPIRDNFGNISALFTSLASISSTVGRVKQDVSTQANNCIHNGILQATAKLEDAAKVKDSTVHDLVKNLLLLKKASNEIPILSRKLNDCIDQRLDLFTSLSNNVAGHLLDVLAQLRDITGPESSLAKQLIDEHKCFEGAANALFNDRTSRQDIDYVLRALEPAVDNTKVLQMYKSFEELYKNQVESGLLALRKEGATTEGFDSFLSRMVDASRDSANDFGQSYEDQVVFLTASVFTVWTLQNTKDCLSIIGSDESYLLKPHAAQVVAVWLLLNCVNADYQDLENKLVQVLTGEGKSVVLGVTATILGLCDWSSYCVCYSSYLSGRDSNDFKNLFAIFGVQDLVQYGTFRDLFYRYADSDYNADCDRCFKGDLGFSNKSSKVDRPRVLLIDEADVFFQEGVYGAILHPCAQLRSAEMIRFFENLHQERSQVNTAKTQSSIKKISNDYVSSFRPIVDACLNQAVSTSKGFSGSKDTSYSVINGEIAETYMDGYQSYCGNLQCLRYVEAFNSKQITRKQMEDNIFLSPFIGTLSDAEYPFNFEVILGVTGTLKGLGGSERDVLQGRYKIGRYAYIPSVYGANRLSFAEESDRGKSILGKRLTCRLSSSQHSLLSDVILCETSDDHHLELVNEIRSRRGSGGNVVRPVMVFFDSSKSLHSFYESGPMKQFQSITHTLTHFVPSEEKDSAFLKATGRKAITLMVREFGRGTDFKCFDSELLEAGGVHVVQAFFSVDRSEEIQIKGRTARQGAKGSFSMVLNYEQLSRDFRLSKGELDSMKARRNVYSGLNTKRDDVCSLESRSLLVKEAEELHYRTIACRDYLRTRGRAPLDLKPVADFFLELNGGAACDAFKKSGLKQQILKEASQRRMERAKGDKEKRTLARALPINLFSYTEEQLKDKALTFYEILGVTSAATTEEVKRAYKRASLLYHPDKSGCQGQDYVFHALTLAHETLIDSTERSAYDNDLARTKHSPSHGSD